MAATFCWYCHGDLVGRNGTKDPTKLVFEEVVVDGNKVRVHRTCAKVMSQPQYRNMEVDRHEDDTDNWW